MLVIVALPAVDVPRKVVVPNFKGKALLVIA
jgi:hypothetical protein